MDILQIVANIAQIIGVCWAILFGGKALTDIVKGKLPSARTFTNILLAVICVVLITSLFHPTTFSNLGPSTVKSGTSVPKLTATPSPAATPSPTPTPITITKNRNYSGLQIS
jgi:predicted anti-sigma-YlaC factor YlaD